jgi:hypothetical protein
LAQPRNSSTPRIAGIPSSSCIKIAVAMIQPPSGF